MAIFPAKVTKQLDGIKQSGEYAVIEIDGTHTRVLYDGNSLNTFHFVGQKEEKVYHQVYNSPNLIILYVNN